MELFFLVCVGMCVCSSVQVGNFTGWGAVDFVGEGFRDTEH
jgi:hypothetical protein